MKELSLHILDLVENSVRANASCVNINVIENKNQDEYSIQIVDNGDGMSQDILQKVSDPFFTSRTVRKVGLGVPLFKQAVEQTNGKFSISSEIKKGTTITGIFGFSHYDRQTMGKISGVLALLFAMNQNITIIYTHQTNTGSFTMSNAEIKSALDNADLNNSMIMSGIEELITNQLININFSN